MLYLLFLWQYQPIFDNFKETGSAPVPSSSASLEGECFGIVRLSRHTDRFFLLFLPLCVDLKTLTAVMHRLLALLYVQISSKWNCNRHSRRLLL